MSFLREHTYTTGTTITGADVRENHEGLRKWVNRLLRTADLVNGSVDWTHLQAGEYAHVTPDHRFSTGNHYSLSVDSDASRQTAIGSSMKTTGLGADLFVPVLGKRCRASVLNSLALVTVFLQVVPLEDVIVDGADGAADVAYLYIDGVQVEASEARFYADDSGTSAASSGTGPTRLRVATLHALAEGLTAGLHDFEVRMNPMHSTSLIRARSFNVEFFEG